MINRCMTQLVEELLANEVPEPLSREFLLAAIWDDLCRFAGEEPPDQVHALLRTRDIEFLPLPGAGAAPTSDRVAAGEQDAAPRSQGGGR